MNWQRQIIWIFVQNEFYKQKNGCEILWQDITTVFYAFFKSSFRKIDVSMGLLL